MPNHVTTICTVTGPDDEVRRFERTHLISKKNKRDGAYTHFDFDTVIPMPASVKATMRGDGVPMIGDLQVETCATAMLQSRCTYILPDERSRYHIDPSIRTWAELIAWYEKKQPAAIDAGKALLIATGETGYPGWYEWSCAEWGTKWDSYDCVIKGAAEGELTFKFDTAWSFPEPIFHRLAKMYPSLVLAVTSYDEGSNFACIGEFNGKNNYRKVPATDALYERVYGHKKPQYDEQGNEIEASP